MLFLAPLVALMVRRPPKARTAPAVKEADAAKTAARRAQKKARRITRKGRR